MARLSGAEAIVESLIKQGVDTVFALPGGQLDHLFDAIYERQDKIRLIHSRHEQGVAYMAYGYTRSTGKVGVFGVVPGPGVLNASGALCTAWGNYAPVLCISGQIPSTAIGKQYGDLHEINDQLGMLDHIAKWTERIEHPVFAPEKINHAFKELKNGAPRPVVLEMAMDIMGLKAEVKVPPADSKSIAPTIDKDQIDSAVKMLKKAKRPMIVIGSGALGAGKPLLKLAEQIQAPVMACRGGKGVVSSDHYLSANFPMGHELWGKADVVLAIGTRLHWPLVMWGNDDDLSIIRVDIDAEQVSRICEPELGIVGDAKKVSAAIATQLSKDKYQAKSRQRELESLATSMDKKIRAKVGPQMAYLDVIREELPRNGIFVDEVTQVGFTSWYGFPVYKPRQHISAGYMGTLGFGYATALGVQAGNMNKKVIQISGDGGIMFTIQELATAVQYRLPLVTIIFNDNRYTNVQRQQKEWFDGHVICSDLHNPDFVAMAKSFGAAGFAAYDPESMRVAIKKAFNEKGPSIIEVSVKEFFPAPWPFLMMPQNRKNLCT